MILLKYHSIIKRHSMNRIAENIHVACWNKIGTFFIFLQRLRALKQQLLCLVKQSKFYTATRLKYWPGCLLRTTQYCQIISITQVKTQKNKRLTTQQKWIKTCFFCYINFQQNGRRHIEIIVRKIEKPDKWL